MGKINCKVCKEEIQEEALKCIHCGSFQNFRRHLNISTSILSLLVALVTVASVAPFLWDSISTKESEFSINYLEKRDRSQGTTKDFLITLYISNTGERPGLIRNGQISYKLGDLKFNINLLMEGIKGDKSLLDQSTFEIDAGKSFVIDFMALPIPPDSLDMITLSKLESKPIELVRDVELDLAYISIINFDGSRNRKRITIQKEDIVPIIQRQLQLN